MTLVPTAPTSIESFGGESAYYHRRLSEAVAEYAGSSDDHAYQVAALKTLTRELSRFHGHRVLLTYGGTGRTTTAKSLAWSKLSRVWLKLDRFGELCVEHAGGPKTVKAASVVAKLTPMSTPATEPMSESMSRSTRSSAARRSVLDTPPSGSPRRGRVDWEGMAWAGGMTV